MRNNDDDVAECIRIEDMVTAECAKLQLPAAALLCIAATLEGRGRALIADLPARRMRKIEQKMDDARAEAYAEAMERKA